MAEDRWEALEQRVRVVEQALGLGPDVTRPAESAETVPPEAFWVLDGLRRQLPSGSSGAVVFAGSVRVADGPVEWQYGRATDDLIGTDAVPDTGDPERDLIAERLAALGHPVRLRLARAVLRGHHSAAALAELEGMGTTGQVYHHLRTLTAAGWLASAGRGRLQVPPERVVPLLAVLAAAL